MLQGRDDDGFFVREVFGQSRGHSGQRSATYLVSVTMTV
jgi:hypothetical protein